MASEPSTRAIRTSDAIAVSYFTCMYAHTMIHILVALIWAGNPIAVEFGTPKNVCDTSLQLKGNPNTSSYIHIYINMYVYVYIHIYKYGDVSSILSTSSDNFKLPPLGPVSGRQIHLKEAEVVVPRAVKRP